MSLGRKNVVSRLLQNGVNWAMGRIGTKDATESFCSMFIMKDLKGRLVLLFRYVLGGSIMNQMSYLHSSERVAYHKVAFSQIKLLSTRKIVHYSVI